MSGPGEREKILFVGAGGAVASVLLPSLAKHYDIVGIAGSRKDLERQCIDFYSADLIKEPGLFSEIFSRHAFKSIVWNSVRYHPGPLLQSSRQTLHEEFDIAVALPVECLRSALEYGFGKDATFILVTSGLAFFTKESWGSYSIVKHGQVILAEYLAQELAAQGVSTKAIALGTVTDIPATTFEEVFLRAIRNADPVKILYKAYGERWE